MCLVGDDDDVLTFRQQSRTLFKLLYRREDDSARLQVFQLAHQVFAPCGLGQFPLGIHLEAYALRLLSEELLTTSKLLVQLLVKVVAVSHHYDGTLWETLYQLMDVEHHRQRLPRTLRMPEHTNLTVAVHRRFRMPQRLVHGKVLVVGAHDLCHASVLMVEADEVLQDVREPVFLEDAAEEGLVVGHLVGFRMSVHALPFHIAVGFRRDGSCLGGQHVAGHAEGVEHKQAGTFLLILLHLQVGIVLFYVFIAG